MYGEEPPVAALAVALPNVEQPAFVCEAIVIATAVGCVMVTLAVALHPAGSVTVTVKEPALKTGPVGLEAETVEVPFDQLYVYGLKPPVVVTVALPLLCPLQVTLAVATAVAVN